MEIVTRKEALERELTHYFTGKSCKRGHVSIRRVSDGCVKCRSTWYDKEYYREYNKQSHVKKYSKTWYKNNPDRQKQYQAKYAKNHPDKVCYWAVKRKADKIQRTPAWADLEVIKLFYECRPANCHVDHIIPLRGKNISGLHVETNLQWLPERDNLIKGNKFQI